VNQTVPATCPSWRSRVDRSTDPECQTTLSLVETSEKDLVTFSLLFNFGIQWFDHTKTTSA
jgi:hypothetical protein